MACLARNSGDEPDGKQLYQAGQYRHWQRWEVVSTTLPIDRNKDRVGNPRASSRYLAVFDRVISQSCKTSNIISNITMGNVSLEHALSEQHHNRTHAVKEAFCEVREVEFKDNTDTDRKANRQETPASFDFDAALGSNMLITSPYTSPDHQLDLRTVDISCQLLALALTKLDAATPEYAQVDYESALNWSAVFQELQLLSDQTRHQWLQSRFYIVEFRSQLKSDIDGDRLFMLDRESHREAAISGGLLKYWYGSPDSNRRNLATCVWRHKDDAIAGGKGPRHKEARGIIPEMYQSINVKGLELTIEKGVKSWSFRRL